MDVFGGAPRFLAYPRPLVVQGGTDAVLKCQIAGDPRPAVIWERANKQLHPDGRYRLFEDGNIYNLIISRVGAEDSGQYICKAKNSIGETYAAATLKVEGEAPERALREENKPHFLIKPLSVRVGRSEDAVFSCKLWGKPRPEIIWEKDGKKLNDIFESAHFSIGHQDGGWFQLKIFQTRAPDAGVYTCRARNEHGEALAGAVLLVDAGPGHEEEAATLNGYVNGNWKHHQGKRGSMLSGTHNIEEPAPNSAKVKMFTVSEGKHAKFRCYVTGKPKPEIVWRKDGVVIMSGRRYLLYEDREGYFTLKVLYCKQQDNGLYVCAASNTAGQTLSAVHLNVKEPAVRFKQPLNDVEVRERELAVLECEVSVDSVPTTWYLEDRRLQPGAKYGIEQCGTVRRLTIRDIGADDDGIYLCEMADGGRSIAEVSVRGTIVRKLPRKVDLLEGENAAFCVEVEDEEMDIHWFKDGLELRETHQTILKSFGKTHILVFVNATPQDSGIVTFVVGRSKTSSQLRVKAVRQSPPSCPVGVQMNTERSNSALLSWVPAHDSRKNPPTGYVLERQEVGSQEWLQCLTTDLASAVEILGDSVPSEADYRFRICSVNKYGRSGHVEFSSVVHLVPVARIKTPLQDVLVSEGKDAEFSIELSALVIGTWFLNGSQIQEDERYTIHRSRTEHSLRLKATNPSDNRSEITFIAYGVRDSAMLYVQPPPVKFESLPEMDRNKKTEAGSPIVLYCELSDANAQVHWYKDGVELHTQEGIHVQSEGTMRRLVIQSADFSHSGEYRCDAIDDVLKFNVEVEAPPVKFNPLPEADLHKSIVESSPVVLYCQVSRPDAPVRWYKDGIEIQPSDGITVQSDKTMRRLVIQSSKLSDSGVYTCHAVDDAVVFNVNIQEPPVTVVHPRGDVHLEHQVSEQIVLSCELSRSNAAVHWYKDGQELLESDDVILESEGPHRRLIILQGRPENSGEYVCDTADDSIFYQVTVTEPAVQIVSPSQSPMVLEFLTEECVVLSCEVSRPNADVRWYQDGLELEETEDLILETEGVHRRLIIPKAAVQDSAEYICDAVDDSVTFMVKITEPPVKFVRPHKAPGAVKVFVGDPVVLECEVSHSNAKVSWRKEGQEMEDSKEVTIEEVGVLRRLTIHSPKLEDSGNYFCDAKDETMDFRVKVTEAPVQIKRKGELKTQQQVMVSDDVVLECELSRANGTIKWYKDGEKITDNERVCLEEEGAFRSLVILNAETSDSGEYFCDACDDSVVFHVCVKEPPVTIIGNSDSPEHHSLIAGDDLVLSCELSRSNATVEWYCNGKPLSSEDSRICIETIGSVRQLVISGLRPSDSAEYICNAGDDKMVTTVTVKEPPVQILNKEDAKESIDVVENDSVTLCARVSKEDAAVQWLKNWKDISGERYCASSDGKSRLFSIRKVQLSDSGVYTCDAFSDEIHFTLQVKAAPIKFERKQEKPEDVFATETENTIMSAVVSSEKSEVKWLRHQSQIFDSEKYETRVEGRVHSLIVKNTSKEDCGMYTCISQDDEMVFVVSVKELKLNFVRSLEEVYAYKDDTIILRCELCKPKGDVQWLKDGQQILPSRHLAMKAEGRERSLTIHRATGNDTGEYVCESKDDKTCARVTVEMPRVVEVIAELHNVTVLEGEDATLKCVVSPEDAKLVWHRNGNVVVPDDKFVVSRKGLCHTLTIRDCQLTDSSKVTAEAEGVVSKANLQVQEAQVLFTKKMEAVIAEEHGEATLEVEVSLESGEVQWMRQGVVIQPSPKFTLSAKGRKRSLTVHNLTFSDRGTFRCETLHDRTQGKLNVEPRKISIKKGLTDTETLERETASFEVEVSHVDVEGVWQKDGIRIKPNNNWRVSTHGRVHALTLYNLTLEDSGTVTFSAESVRTSARLTVKEPPVMFLRALEDLRIPESSGASLECELSRQNADVKWLKNGEELKPGKNYRIYSMGRKRFLQITKCGIADSGTYTCDAVDSKVTAVLDVYERDVEIVQGLQDANIQEDKNAVFMCEVSVEDVKGEWLRNGEKIRPTSNVRIRQEGNKHFLLICNVKAEDSGKITFVAKQAESTANLEVEELPVQIVKPLRDKTALEKHRVILECTVSNPRCSVRWYQGETLILPSDHYEICSEGCYRKLVIQHVTAMDEGTYSVQVGEHESSARLLVEEQAILVVRQLEDVEVKAPEEARFECEISVPIVKPPQWSLNGQPLQNGNGVRMESAGTVHRLILKETSSEMVGIVKFTTGKARSSARLSIKC
ncbi:obscurin-like protein 1 isoform X4 [Acipenser ruthenus]|uniref:obscurin-like protein 1 isoform X4 n=1 Tax=Acipenser ruthenus TaxID=7906 RepID=UPI0027405980|nr:obscurin-like protein 1 isoform X4 [Acipenser ruthenus]